MDIPMFSRKMRNALRMNRTLILNIIYRFFLKLFHSLRNVYRFKVFAEFWEHHSKRSGARLIIDKRLYLGGKYIGIWLTPSPPSGCTGFRLPCEGAGKAGPGVGVVTVLMPSSQSEIIPI